MSTETDADWKAARDTLLKSKKPASTKALATVAAGTREALDLVIEKLVAHGARLQALESRRTMSFAGPHDPGRAYSAGDVVQRSGSIFVALVDTNEQPGQAAAWRLIGVSK